MKNRWIFIMLTIVCIAVLSSCSNELPEDKIQEDIAVSVSEYEPFLTFSDAIVTDSQKDGETYTVVADVTADSRYAKYKLTAMMEYVCVEERWEMTSCLWDWNEENLYEITTYPTIDEVTSMVSTNEELAESKLGRERINNQSDITIKESGNQIICTGEVTDTASYFIPASCKVTSVWEYYPPEDNWILREFSKNEVIYDFSKLEGTWRGRTGMQPVTESAVKITNIVENGFDLEFLEPEYGNSNVVSLKVDAEETDKEDNVLCLKGEGFALNYTDQNGGIWVSTDGTVEFNIRLGRLSTTVGLYDGDTRYDEKNLPFEWIIPAKVENKEDIPQYEGVGIFVFGGDGSITERVSA